MRAKPVAVINGGMPGEFQLGCGQMLKASKVWKALGRVVRCTHSACEMHRGLISGACHIFRILLSAKVKQDNNHTQYAN
jgi:hypothetical protein